MDEETYSAGQVSKITSASTADKAVTGVDHRWALTRIRALNGAAIALYSTPDLDHILQLIVSNARSIFEMDTCMVFLANRWAGSERRSLVRASLSTQSRVEASGVDRAIYQAVAKHTSPAVLHRGEDAELVTSLLGVTSAVALPLRTRDEMLGAIVMGSDAGRGDFAPQEQDLAESFAALAALAIENACQFETLRTSEEKYRKLVERAIDVVFATDGGGKLTVINYGAQSVLGFAPVELIGRPLLDIVAPASRPTAVKHFRQAQKGYLPKDAYEIDVLRRDGAIANAEITVTSVYRNGLLHARQGILRDVTERKRIEREIVRRNEELSALYAISDMFDGRLELGELLDRVLERVLGVTQLPIGLTFILDEENAVLHLKAFRESTPGMIKPIPKVRLGAGISGRVAVTGDPIFVENMRQDPRMFVMAPGEQDLGSMICVPLKSGCKVVGVMALMSESLRQFSHRESQLLSTIAHYLGSVIDNANVREKLVAAENNAMLFPREESHVQIGLPDGLSPREMDVLRLLASGRSGKEIAPLLNISDKTVRTHISRIYQKLHVYDRVQLVLYALGKGIVDVAHDGPEPALQREVTA